MGVRRVIHLNIKDKWYHSHSLFFLSINAKTSSFPPNSIKPLKTDRQHDCTCFLVNVLWININIFPMASKHHKIKHSSVLHTLRITFKTPLCSGDHLDYTQVCESRMKLPLIQMWISHDSSTPSKVMGSHPYYTVSILVLQTGYLHRATKIFDVQHKHLV